MPFASKAAAEGDWWWTFRPSLPERSDNSETFVLSLDERLLNVSLARSARSSGVVLGNSINNSPLLRCALFLIFRALSSASLFLACCPQTSNARALSRSSFASSTRWHSAIALHLASYRMRAGGCSWLIVYPLRSRPARPNSPLGAVLPGRLWRSADGSNVSSVRVALAKRDHLQKASPALSSRTL